MKIIALETTTEACSAALNIDGRVIERYRMAPREHNRIILPMIRELLDEAGLALREIDAIAFGRGPGSFTGVRIAAGVAQGLALSRELPLIPISTLAALSLEALEENPDATALAAIDARIGEVYFGSFRVKMGDVLEPIDPEVVILPDMVRTSSSGDRIGTGSGWMSYRNELAAALGQPDIMILVDRYPKASSIVRLAAPEFRMGHLMDPAAIEPVYLRNEVARKPI